MSNETQQELFNYLEQEYDNTPLESAMQEIERIVNKPVVDLIAQRVATWKRWLENHRINMEDADNDYDGGYNAGLKVFLEDEIDLWEQIANGVQRIKK